MSGYGQQYGATGQQNYLAPASQPYGAPAGQQPYGAPIGQQPYGAPPGQPIPYGGPGGQQPPYVAPPGSSQQRPAQPPSAARLDPSSAANAKEWFSVYYQQLSPAEHHRLQAWFNSCDRDRSGSISFPELQQAVWPHGRPFNQQAVARFMKIFDGDRSGFITYFEYAALHQVVNILINAFFQADTDRTYSLESSELPRAIQAAGFIPDPELLSLCTRRLQSQGSTRVGIDEFVALGVTLHHVRAVFSEYDTQRSGVASLSLSQFMTALFDVID